MHILLDTIDVLKHKSIVLAAVVAKDRIAAGERFCDATNPEVAVYNAETGNRMATYKLAAEFPDKDAVCFARFDYDEESFFWHFTPLAEGHNGGMQFLATEVYN